MNATSAVMQSSSDQEGLENFKSLVFENTGILLRTAVRMCGNTQADDIVQETLLRAWKYWHTFEQGTNCRAWLFRIMINIIHREGERLESTTKHVSIQEPMMDNVLHLEPRLEIDEHRTLAALERLPAKYKEVMLLVLVEEFSYKEVAAMLKVPIGTVMSRLNRARQMMKSLLRAPSYGK
jgi:RNA polymerase sigma-70 factor, ECF subfamily